MTTPLTKPVNREIVVGAARGPVIVSLFPDGFLRLRPKRRKRYFEVALEGIFYLLAKGKIGRIICAAKDRHPF